MTSARASLSVCLGDGEEISSLGGDVNGWTASGWTTFEAAEAITKPWHVVAVGRLWSSERDGLIFGEGVENGFLIRLVIGCDSESVLFRAGLSWYSNKTVRGNVFAYWIMISGVAQFDGDAMLGEDRFDRVKGSALVDGAF
jgi:hypothetical protein